MIINEFYNTQGLGNQLWCYVVTRVLALDNGYKFGLFSPEKFRGKEFMDLDFGLEVKGEKSDTWSELLPEGTERYYREELIRNKYGIDISPSDKNLFKIQDNTKIDGHFQSMNYIEHRKKEITEWLKIKEKNNFSNFSKDDITVIHLRGGDYISSPANTLLPFKYYKDAMDYMKTLNKDMKFFVVTDDLQLAHLYFDNVCEIIGSTALDIPNTDRAAHHIGGDAGFDYAILNNAKNVIMSNSTFGFWAVWTNKKLKNVVAPKYWFTFNHPDNFWSTSEMKVNGWKYLDREGNIE